MLDPQLLQAIHDSGLGRTVRDISWMFAALETAHFMGLCLLIGAMTLVDLRLLGVLRGGRLSAVLGYTHVAVLGFAINLASGVGFFASNPGNYDQNPLFWAKMSLVALAGCNVGWFELVERRKLLALPDGAAAGPDTRVVAALSLLLWASIIILGRLLPLLGTG